MSKVLIICIESPLNKSDHIYIDTILKNQYSLTSNVKLQFLSLNGKGNYNSQKIQKKIETFKRQTAPRQVQVIYCLDTDNFYLNANIKKLNEDIQSYCNQMGYELVWFCPIIENLIWGHEIASSEKTYMAQKFASNSNIQLDLDSEKFLKENISKNSSNLLLILNKYLNKK